MPGLEDVYFGMQLQTWLLVILVLVVVWYFYKNGETLMPGDTQRYQRVSLSGSEALETGRTGSYFVQAVQGQPIQYMSGVVPGSAVSNAEILTSPDFACSGAEQRLADESSAQGAWNWLNAAVREPGAGQPFISRPRTANDLSLAMAGY